MSSRSGEAISDGVLLAAIGGVVAVAGTLWLWGGIAGAVFGSGWPGFFQKPVRPRPAFREHYSLNLEP